MTDAQSDTDWLVFMDHRILVRGWSQSCQSVDGSAIGRGRGTRFEHPVDDYYDSATNKRQMRYALRSSVRPSVVVRALMPAMSGNRYLFT